MPNIEAPTTPEQLPPLLGFGGLFESGKDSAADHLVDTYGFAKVNMSTPIDACLIALNPIVIAEAVKYGFFRRLWRSLLGKQPEIRIERYRDVRERLGFTDAKKLKEFRSLLQRMGVEVGREIIDEDIWVDIAERSIQELRRAGTAVCISGIRFVSELDLVTKLGGTLVWVDRPGHVGQIAGGTSAHSSEHGLTADGFDVVLLNDSSLEGLHAKTDLLLIGLHSGLAAR